MTKKIKNPKKYRKKPEDCDHKNLKWTELDKNKEKRRRSQPPPAKAGGLV